MIGKEKLYTTTNGKATNREKDLFTLNKAKEQEDEKRKRNKQRLVKVAHNTYVLSYDNRSNEQVINDFNKRVCSINL